MPCHRTGQTGTTYTYVQAKSRAGNMQCHVIVLDTTGTTYTCVHTISIAPAQSSHKKPEIIRGGSQADLFFILGADEKKHTLCHAVSLFFSLFRSPRRHCSYYYYCHTAILLLLLLLLLPPPLLLLLLLTTTPTSTTTATTTIYSFTLSRMVCPLCTKKLRTNQVV